MDLARKLGVRVEEIMQRVHDLHEFNPMLGHRGCRLAISYPEIAEMQAQAIFEAAQIPSLSVPANSSCRWRSSTASLPK